MPLVSLSDSGNPGLWFRFPNTTVTDSSSGFGGNVVNGPWMEAWKWGGNLGDKNEKNKRKKERKINLWYGIRLLNTDDVFDCDLSSRPLTLINNCKTACWIHDSHSTTFFIVSCGHDVKGFGNFSYFLSSFLFYIYVWNPFHLTKIRRYKL